MSTQSSKPQKIPPERHEETLENALNIIEKFDPDELTSLSDMVSSIERGARLLDEKSLLNFIEKVENLPPENRDEIVEEAIEISKKYDLNDIHSINTLLNSVEQGARLVEEETLLSLLEEIEKLPPAQRDVIKKLVSVEGYEEVIAWARKIANLMEQGHSLAEIENAFEIAKQLDPDDLDLLEDLKSRIRGRLEEVEEKERSIAGEIEEKSGPLVREIGGSIDPTTGVVTLPDRALFPQGRSDITPTLARFLNGFCVEWLGTLKKFGQSIESVRIEGHASSEWELESSPQTAFLNNMELSQARASNVLERCLILSGDGELGQWGRSKLVAVGRSSSRLVTTPAGQEDRIKSRRVMFRFEIDKEHILSEIQEDVQALDSATKP